MIELKQVILIRKDLKMSKGKIAVQTAHASVSAVLKSDKQIIKEWEKQGMKKITLSIENTDELFNYMQQAKDLELKTALIKDAGRTEIEPGTITCLAIGPDKENKINKITKNLKNF